MTNLINNTTILIVVSILGYFLLLMGISYVVGKRSSENSFFTGDRASPWGLVAYGMVGATLSGVTFISVPGMVGNNFFYYFQFVIGNMIGYLFVAFVLIPIYYKLKLVSIYSYLDARFGKFSYKTSSLIFLISQSFGSALRLLLAAKVLQYSLFDQLGVPFEISIIIILVLIWLYTNRSGIKAIVWTDTLQTTLLILSVIITVWTIKTSMNISIGDMISGISSHPYSEIFNWDFASSNYFFKQIISGILISIAMMGLDQNIMQKTLTCRNQKDAQKNALMFSFVLAITQFLFLALGVLLYMYSEANNIELIQENGKFINSDQLFPMLSLEHFGVLAVVFFILGITAAAFSSVDSSLTAMTTSFTYDFLRMEHRTAIEKKKLKNRTLLGFNIIVFLIILCFENSQGAIISTIFKVAGYTYGPLLGIFSLGIFSNVNIRDRWIPYICVVAPVMTYYINEILISYQFHLGFMNIFVNASLTIFLLYLSSIRYEKNN